MNILGRLQRAFKNIQTAYLVFIMILIKELITIVLGLDQMYAIDIIIYKQIGPYVILPIVLFVINSSFYLINIKLAYKKICNKKIRLTDFIWPVILVSIIQVVLIRFLVEALIVYSHSNGFILFLLLQFVIIIGNMLLIVLLINGIEKCRRNNALIDYAILFVTSLFLMLLARFICSEIHNRLIESIINTATYSVYNYIIFIYFMSAIKTPEEAQAKAEAFRKAMSED